MICWIHGALSTDRSFNYLRTLLPEHDKLVFTYSAKTPLGTNISELEKILKTSPITAIVGHSLGGVMAALMVKRLHIPKAVAIASPFAGSMLANFMPMSQMLSDIRSTNPLFSELSHYNFDCNFLNIVATGLEDDIHQTDGVVAISSQKALTGTRIEEVSLNHFEVLLDNHVGSLIRSHLFS